jgi:hypothetical protein
MLLFQIGFGWSIGRENAWPEGELHGKTFYWNCGSIKSRFLLAGRKFFPGSSQLWWLANTVRGPIARARAVASAVAGFTPRQPALAGYIAQVH